MQLELSESSEDEDVPDIVEVTLLMPKTSDASTSVQELFEAVSNCSNLHPDPGSNDDEDEEMADGDSRIVFEGVSGLPGVMHGAVDGGLPPPFPGSGGWITAENVGQYFDEEGNWIGEGEQVEGEPLAVRTARVRGRDEVENEEAPQTNGHGRENGEESKRQRTE